MQAADQKGAVQADAVDGDHDPEDTARDAFPVAALSPLMRDLVTSIADVYQIPPAMPAMAALAVAAGAVGKQYKLVNAVNAQESYANLFVIASADRGAGKGNVANVVAKPLIDAQQVLAERFLPGKIRLETEASLLHSQIKVLTARAARAGEDAAAITQDLEKKKLRLAEIEPDGLPITMPGLIEGNCTSEALATSLRSGDQSLMLFSPEAAEVLRVAAGKYNKNEKGDFDLLLSGWSSEQVTYNRVSRGRLHLRPTLSALLFVQPVIVDELLANDEAFQRGLTARMLMFDSEIELRHDDGVERKLPPHILERWAEHIRWLTKNRPTPLTSEVRCSQDARESFRIFHNMSINARRGGYADVSGELSRWRENAIRVALNLWLADGNGGEVTGEQASRAISIVYWCCSSYMRLLNRGRGARKMSQIQALRILLVDTPEKEITLRDLANRHGFDQAEVRRLAAEFPDQLTIITKSPSAKGGRPSEVLAIP